MIGGPVAAAVDRPALALVAIGVATSSWNAVLLGPLSVGHVALALAGLAALVLATLGGRVVTAPWWIWLLGASVALSCVLALLWPPGHVVFAGRFDYGAGAAMLDRGLAAANVRAALKWLVAAVAVPVVASVTVLGRPDRVRLLVDAWIVGTTINAAVAVGDAAGVTRISPFLLANVDYLGRQAALTVQPNHAALAIAMALPPAVWRLVTSRHPLVGLAAGCAAVVLVCGLAATGSRAGLVVAVLGVGAIGAFDPRARRLVTGVAMVGLTVGVAVLAVVPSLIGGLGERLRVVNGLGADGSDALRARLAEQAVSDVDGAPVHGVGLVVADQAHDIYLQLAASGGVLLLVGYLVAQLGFLHRAWALRLHERGLGAALAVSGGVVLVAGLASNQLTDVFVSVPLALVAGLSAARLEPGAVDPVDIPTPVRREEIPA